MSCPTYKGTVKYIELVRMDLAQYIASLKAVRVAAESYSCAPSLVAGAEPINNAIKVLKGKWRCGGILKRAIVSFERLDAELEGAYCAVLNLLAEAQICPESAAARQESIKAPHYYNTADLIRQKLVAETATYFCEDDRKNPIRVVEVGMQEPVRFLANCCDAEKVSAYVSAMTAAQVAEWADLILLVGRSLRVKGEFLFWDVMAALRVQTSASFFVRLSKEGALFNTGTLLTGVSDETTFEGEVIDTPTFDGESEDTPTFDGETIDTPTFDGESDDTPTFDGETIDTPTIDGESDDTPTFDGETIDTPTLDGESRSPVFDGQSAV